MKSKRSKQSKEASGKRKKRKKKSGDEESVASSDCDSDIKLNISTKRVKQNDSNEIHSIQSIFISTENSIHRTIIPSVTSIPSIDIAASIPSTDIAASIPLANNQRKKRNRIEKIIFRVITKKFTNPNPKLSCNINLSSFCSIISA